MRGQGFCVPALGREREVEEVSPAPKGRPDQCLQTCGSHCLEDQLHRMLGTDLELPTSLYVRRTLRNPDVAFCTHCPFRKQGPPRPQELGKRQPRVGAQHFARSTFTLVRAHILPSFLLLRQTNTDVAPCGRCPGHVATWSQASRALASMGQLTRRPNASPLLALQPLREAPAL